MDMNKLIRKDTDGQRLSLEIGTKMLVTFEGLDTPAKALFVGMEPGAYIVIRLPELTGLSDRVGIGKRLHLRYVSLGMVYGFNCTVLGQVTERGLGLLILSYPTAAQSYDKRQEERLDSYVPAVLNVQKTGFSGYLLDLSPSGCRFAFDSSSDNTRPAIRLGQEATISFQLPSLEGEQIFASRISNIRHDGRSLSLGLKFDLKSGATFNSDVFRSFLSERLR